MNPILRNVLAVIAGIAVGMIVNMGLVTISGSIIAPPEGVNPSDMESLKENMHLFQPQHFIMPFLAHALGTLAGAFVAALIAVSYKMKIAIGMGFFFLIGGIVAVTMIPSPTWFAVLDLVGAYIPMGMLGGKLGIGANSEDIK
ncbi:MAG: hypothetical protein ACPG49_09145 [Chitinophagales bacterium]